MACTCVLPFGVLFAAEEASIDRLLGKLPPPEKLVKRSESQGTQRKDPALQDPLFVSAFSSWYLKDISQALFYARRLSEKYPQSENALLLWGEFAYHLRYYDEAAVVFQKAAALAPRDASAWMELAKAENAKGHVVATMNAMNKAAEVSPNDGELAAVLGFNYINLDRAAQAIPPLQRAAKLLPQDYFVQSQLGYCFLVTGKVGTAITYLERGATLNSKYGPVWQHLGVAYQKQGRHRDAVVALEKATQLLPSSPLSWKHLAEAYQATGRSPDAQRAAARAQKLGAPLTPNKKKK